LKDNPGKKDKIKILQENDSPLLRKVCQYAYDTSMMFYFSKPLSYRKNPNDSFEEHADEIFSVLEDLSSRKITGLNADREVRRFEAVLDPLSLELFQNIMKKDLDCGINIKTINKAFGEDFIDDFSVQLAEKYDQNREYNTNYFYISPKLDGIRGVYYNGHFITRNNKPIVGFDHLIAEFELFNRLIVQYNGDAVTPYLIDGEVYGHGEEFEKIQSIVMRSKNPSIVDTMRLKYNVFGFDVREKVTAEIMTQTINKIFSNHDFKYLAWVPQEKISNDYNKIVEKAQEYISQGYEGAMIRVPQSVYTFRRSHDLVKVKFMNELDMKILSIIPHKKQENRAGAMNVTGFLDDGTKITCDVAVSKKEHQEDFWLNPDKYIGKTIEVHYQNVTDDGSIRFPVFKKFKLDRGFKK